MGKCCAMPECPSGRCADRARRARCGLRQVALFSIPKGNNALQKWSESVGRNLSAKDFICELHFLDKSIIKENKTILFDGSVHSIPRDKYALAENAIPIAIGNVNDADTMHDISDRMDAEDFVGFGDHLLDTSSTLSIGQDEVNNNRSHSPEHCFDVLPEPSGDDEVWDNVQRTSLANSVTDNGEDVELHSDVDMLECDERGGSLDDTSLYSDSEDFFSNDDDSQNESTDYAERNVGEHMFTIDDIFHHLKETPLPESWCWIRNPKEEDSVVFVQIDTKTLRRRLHLVLHNDLSVTARTPDDKVGAELTGIVSSARKMDILLEDAGGQLVCNGSGMKEESYHYNLPFCEKHFALAKVVDGRIRSRTCTGLIRIGEYKNLVSDPRCASCRQLRKKLIHRSNRRTTNPKGRYARARHASHLKQRRSGRLDRKARVLKQQILQAREQCAALSETTLNDAISSLPLVQQEAVRACLSAAKVKCSNQRRYTLDWVYECLLMRIKNAKLYEHLRSRDILPLPCQDTLSRYIRQLDSRFGFQKAVFNLLSLKASTMRTVDKRGNIHRGLTFFRPNFSAIAWKILRLFDPT